MLWVHMDFRIFQFNVKYEIGYVMGNVLGLVFGSYESIAPPVPLPHERELPKVPVKEQVWRM